MTKWKFIIFNDFSFSFGKNIVSSRFNTRQQFTTRQGGDLSQNLFKALRKEGRKAGKERRPDVRKNKSVLRKLKNLSSLKKLSLKIASAGKGSR